MDGRLKPTGRTDSKLVRIETGPQLACAKGVGHTGHLTDSNFMTRMLFTDMY